MKVTIMLRPTGPDKEPIERTYDNVKNMGAVPPGMLKLEGSNPDRPIALIPLDILMLLEAPENDTSLTVL